MKKLIYLASALFCFVSLVSCDGEEEVNYKSPNYLIGLWDVTQVGALNGQNVLNYEDASTECNFDSYLFNEDMTFTSIDNTFDGTCTATTISGTYEVVNGYAILTYMMDGTATTKTLDLLTLTNTELSLVYTDENSELVFLKMTKHLL